MHRRPRRRVGVLVLAVVVVALGIVGLTAESLGEPHPAETADVEAAPTAGPPSPYAGVGTWLSRYRFTREFGGPTPPVTPADVDTMAAAGVQALYLQPAADDPKYPDLLSPDLLEQFLTRAHHHGMQVVAWYLPHFTDTAADLRRLEQMVAFGFDAVAVDIEFTDGADLPARNAALVDLSRRLRAAVPDVVLGAVVLPPVVTDVLNLGYWPQFPWAEIRDSYDVWLPMAYWSNRREPEWADAARYVGENVRLLREHLGEECAVVSVVGGYDVGQTAEDYAGMARAASEAGAIGVSIYDWPTTPSSAWAPLQDYAASGC
ncbi:hypothetical protein [Petropleomorpha daqingensis]|uniref:Glycosyl hydrolases family 18 n=1 Tax=Petropleomorpha daqingensis TaxID=2026353 RepID=A0A853CGJ9_9ACTN|nr:hypothetical protein [Petropleomorpha daqingensis]NYJ06577.1 hypothetical protein [Petropleomorpha daqingensis]